MGIIGEQSFVIRHLYIHSMGNTDSFIHTTNISNCFDIATLCQFIGYPDRTTTLFNSLPATSLPTWLLYHLNRENNFPIKLESRPPLTLISVSLSHGNASSALVASISCSIEISGFDRSKGPRWWLYFFGSGQ